ncbi:MAG: hypothetical protein ACJA1A_001507 [Saprospiraceae bacterium]|jgi:hypothetical protein
MKNYLLKIILLFVFTISYQVSYSQVTSASMNGTVSSADIELIGATILATHVPSGTTYGSITNENGTYNLPNMRVGGPYKVDVSYIGFTDNTQENIFLTLGQKLKLNFELTEEGVTLDGIEIIGTLDPILNGKKTGAGTTIGRDQLQNLPTISRSADDYTRLNPMSAEGGSFAGRNDQFNNYSLNGTIFNNPFGLDAATPGGQSDAQPVSLDAIDQISVNIAPFDVTQSGFTGASINAVTKSGNNNFEGTVYGFFRNSSMTGGKIGDTEVPTGDLSSLQSGFSIGGPIMKNKAFFFVNLEITKRSDLGSLFEPNTGSGANNESRVLQSDMQMISDLLMSEHGYDTGAFSNFRYNRDNTKGIIRLDFNLNQSHKLSASYNFLDAFKEQPAHPSAIGRRGPDFTTLQFQNSGYRINNKINSGIVELKSVFGSNMANNLKVGYTSFRDDRDPFSDPFPVLNIAKNGINYIIAGHEPFSVNNVLSQDVFQITNDFNLYKNNHSFTFGTSFERFNFDNSFNLTTYGFRVFFPGVDIADAAALITSEDFAGEVQAARDAFANNNANDSWALAETNLGQWSIYAQDEYQASEKLALTFGIRVDVPLYFNTADLIQENIDRKGGTIADGGVYAPDVTYYNAEGEAVNYNHTDLPTGNILINPRLGFNYDMAGDRSSQLRGGTGLFSGRFPAVWIGNQVANPDFFFYNMTDPNFKFPQVWRTSLGFDKKIEDWTGTIDLLYTKDIQAQMVQNQGLKLPKSKLNGVDDRPIYGPEDRAQGPFGGATNAYVFTNTTKGYSFNASFQLQRSWKNNYAMIGYNFLKAAEVNSIDAEISSDAYDRNPANIMHTNAADLAPSLYGNKHRLIGALSKKIEYGSRLATTISLFGEYAQGGRYSYTYSGDINNDGSGLNDLLYIPTDTEIDALAFSGDVASQAAQKTAFKAYIAQDDYLTNNRGDYSKRYDALSPWFGSIDLRILQDIGVSDGNKFQISLDILNVGNMISSSWGITQRATNTGLNQPISVAVTDGNPVYTFDQSLKQTFFDDFGLNSRWQAQLGLRYIFK